MLLCKAPSWLSELELFTGPKLSFTYLIYFIVPHISEIDYRSVIKSLRNSKQNLNVIYNFEEKTGGVIAYSQCEAAAPDVLVHFQKYESQFRCSIERDEVFVSVVWLTRYSSWITINDRIVQIKGLYLTGLNVANIEYLSWFRERPASL